MNRSSLKNVNRWTLLVLSFLLALVWSAGLSFADADPHDAPVLARIEVKKMVDQLGLPVYAHLQGTDKVDYALVIATIEQIKASGNKFEVLHDTDDLDEDMRYLIAVEMVPGARKAAAEHVEVLHDDGRNIIAPATEQQLFQLSKLGLDSSWLKKTPMRLEPRERQLERLNALAVPVTHNADVQAMIDMVTEAAVYKYGADITGDNPITVGGVTQQIYSRNTYDTDIDIATQFAYEFFQSKGLTAEYHQWYSGRNVVATKLGTTKPTEIVIVLAHLDCMPSYGYAPGADDNGSGSVGVMMAAEVMSQYNFERTVRFLLVTGEEQGLLGSDAYASDIYYAGDNVVAAFNMDMIGWDSWGGPVLRLHTRTTSSSGYTADKAIADTFVDVVNVYGMSTALEPMIEPDGVTLSDQASFWWVGYPSILAIEDDYNDFCDNYHTSYDTLSSLNMPYWTNYIKASVGTVAHIAYPVTTGGGPTASFTHTANQLTVNFTDTSTCNNCTIQSRSWNFGDGATSTLQNPSHTYRTAGTYSVTLTVTSSTGQTATSTANITVADQTVPYCTSSAVTQTYEWIAGVAVGGLNNVSGASPYTDFTAQSANLTAGSTVNITLTPGFSGSSYTEYWKVWIDYNGNGSFVDPGEEVFSGMGSSAVNGSFTVPASATGSTRMRVSMDYSGYPAACGSLAYGEVEDYTVTIR